MKIRRVIPLTGIILVLFFGCGSFPTPSSPNDSLVVVICDRSEQAPPQILRFQGPSSAAVDLVSTEWTIKTLKLEGGTYRVSLAGAQGKSIMERFEVKPGMVILFPYVFSVPPDGTLRSQPVNGNMQEKAVQALLNRIDFEQWLGSGYIGFGKARPKMYLSQNSQSITINTDPQGARIYLDNIDWGLTPKTLELSAGKYLLRLEKDGFRQFKRIISVEKNKAEFYRLEPLRAEVEVQKKDTFRIMVYPFINILDEHYNPYGNIFLSTFNVNFMKAADLQVVQAKTGDVNPGKSEYPDLSLAAHNGAELAVAGRYEESGGKLFVHAVLYDVQSGRVKYAVLYISDAGFSVFDSIDEISRSFSRAVSAVLPKPGSPVLEQEGDVSAELSAYEKQLYRNRVIARRCSQAHVLAVLGGIQIMADQVKLPTDSRMDIRSSPRTPLNALKLEYEYIMDPFISLTASLGANVGATSLGDEDQFMLDMHTAMGAKIYFRSSRSDIYLALLASASYVPAFSVHDSGTDYNFGPYFFLGALFNAGVKYYFNSLLSESPFFLDTGIQFDAVTFRFSSGSDPEYVPLNMLIYVGVGWHL
jgi:TolB-like protein